MAIPSTPNLVVFISDQQRAVQYFPPAWVQANLVNLNALTSTGLTFTNAITNSSRCSPSRGVLATGLYAPKTTLLKVGRTLPAEWTTLSKFLQATGLDYQIAYKGKWHMTQGFQLPAKTLPPPAAAVSSENQLLLDNYGTPNWDSPDAGVAADWTPSTPPITAPTPEDPFVSTSVTLGGGPQSYRQNDQRIASDAIAFLQQLDPTRPFALVVSLVNPHDIWANCYSGLMQQAYPEFPAAFFALPKSGGFTLPDSYTQDDLSTKPGIQLQIRNAFTKMWAEGNGVPLTGPLPFDDALLYLQFYAYLTYLADQQFDAVYQVLSGLPQFADTIVVRVADHGELGMSHGGSMAKDWNVYAETLNIPYIFSNPRMFPAAVTCDAQAGLVDLVPTLLGLVGQPPSTSETQGTDLSALIEDPTSAPPSNCSIFTYDDGFPDEVEGPLWHIRAIQAAAGAVLVDGVPTPSAFKYAVYYQLRTDGDVDTATLEYELYVPGQDGEIVNLQPTNPDLQAALHLLLTQRMAAIDLTGPQGGGTVTPSGWPDNPFIGWVQYTSPSILYSSIDISGPSFSASPVLLTSLSCYGDGLYTTGAGIQYGLPSTSAFRAYVNFENGSITPQQATAKQWAIAWTGVDLSGGMAGSTPSGNTGWVQLATDTLYVDIDTSGLGLTETPLYFVSLQGFSNILYTRGANMAFAPTPNGFRVYVQYLQGDVYPDLANHWLWAVSWRAVLPGTAGTGSVSPSSWSQSSKAANQLFFQIDASGDQFPSAPDYFTCLTCTDTSALGLTGPGIVYNPQIAGFGSYLNSDAGDITPADAVAGKWTLNWLAVSRST